ncbi:MAG: HEPN domain-containing protein [Spirochaetia bacterium]|nr:HEPN domain-containing protein [Spirochaetia bacterium]
MEAARADLNRAERTFGDGDYKWATVQLYYSMFHSARALLYSKNLREHSHYCLIRAVRDLFVEKGLLQVMFVEALSDAKNLREDADYYNRWSKEAYEKMAKTTGEFIERTGELIKWGPALSRFYGLTKMRQPDSLL